MRIPRALSGKDLETALSILGYERTRKAGSHIRLTTAARGQHHVTVPDHKVLPLGTFRAILRDVARHFGCTTDEIVSRLFDR